MSGMGDIDEIERVKYRYLRALDTKHWDEFADTLTEDIVGEYGSSLGEEHHFTDRDSLVEFMRSAMPANVITEHRVTQPEIDVDGDGDGDGDGLPAPGICRTGSSCPISTSCSTARPSTTTATGAHPTVGESAPLDMSAHTR